jgi:hypothetical protein
MAKPLLFGLNIAQIAATALQSAGGLYDSTLVRVVPGAINPADPTAGNNPITASYPCKGVAVKIVDEMVDNDSTRRVRGEVMLLLATLPEGVHPRAGDRITTVDPRTGDTVTGTIGGGEGKALVEVDPAGAQATCKVVM